jgi:hypothetical protein
VDVLRSRPTINASRCLVITQSTVTIMSAMALELGITSAVVGTALALRYKVAILIPAIALVATFAALVGIAHGESFWSIILAIAIPGTAIQVGYVAGILIGAILPLPQARTSVVHAIRGLGKRSNSAAQPPHDSAEGRHRLLGGAGLH